MMERRLTRIERARASKFYVRASVQEFPHAVRVTDSTGHVERRNLNPVNCAFIELTAVEGNVEQAYEFLCSFYILPDLRIQSRASGDEHRRDTQGENPHHRARI